MGHAVIHQNDDTLVGLLYFPEQDIRSDNSI
jgi:hypothetical protein